MSRKPVQKTPRLTRRAETEELDSFIPIGRHKKSSEPIQAKTENQSKYIAAIEKFPLTFGVGPAGVGKTWLCASMAAEALASGETKRLILTRPAVEAGESLGFLPGELHEKYEPYLTPFMEVLEERLGKGRVQGMLDYGIIQPVPLAYMRGRTFSNCWVILDEAQNTTPKQMKMFLTRIGNYSTVIVNGDEDQCDLPGPSGLTDSIQRISYIPHIKVVRFTDADVVRSGLAQEIVQAYSQTEKAEKLAPNRRQINKST